MITRSFPSDLFIPIGDTATLPCTATTPISNTQLLYNWTKDGLPLSVGRRLSYPTPGGAGGSITISPVQSSEALACTSVRTTPSWSTPFSLLLLCLLLLVSSQCQASHTHTHTHTHKPLYSYEVRVAANTSAGRGPFSSVVTSYLLMAAPITYTIIISVLPLPSPLPTLTLPPHSFISLPSSSTSLFCSSPLPFLLPFLPSPLTAPSSPSLSSLLPPP